MFTEKTKHFIDITNKEGNEVNCTLSWRALFIWLINELCKGVANGFPAGNREFKSIANCCMDAAVDIISCLGLRNTFGHLFMLLTRL